VVAIRSIRNGLFLALSRRGGIPIFPLPRRKEKGGGGRGDHSAILIRHSKRGLQCPLNSVYFNAEKEVHIPPDIIRVGGL